MKYFIAIAFMIIASMTTCRAGDGANSRWADMSYGANVVTNIVTATNAILTSAKAYTDAKTTGEITASSLDVTNATIQELDVTSIISAVNFDMDPYVNNLCFNNTGDEDVEVMFVSDQTPRHFAFVDSGSTGIASELVIDGSRVMTSNMVNHAVEATSVTNAGAVTAAKSYVDAQISALNTSTIVRKNENGSVTVQGPSGATLYGYGVYYNGSGIRWPQDTSQTGPKFATSTDIDGVLDSFSNHTGDHSNPHQVTPQQIGAATPAAVEAAVLADNTNRHSMAFYDHTVGSHVEYIRIDATNEYPSITIYTDSGAGSDPVFRVYNGNRSSSNPYLQLDAYVVNQDETTTFLNLVLTPIEIDGNVYYVFKNWK